jgi:alpha-ketoglutarate-dependent taurine dioxygenase
MRDVETALWDREHEFILFVKAMDPARCGAAWFAEHSGAIRDALARYGAVFFRGFGGDSRLFEQRVDEVAGDPMTYLGGVSPRSSVHGTVYTATDAPPDLAIVQHHELSYNRVTPRYICFYCDTPSPSGGATPLTDGRRFARTLAAAHPQVIEELSAKGCLFVRNYNEANFKGWRVAWDTSDRGELERKLRDAGVEHEWLGDDWLRTKHRLPAILRQPPANDPVLFSCVHLWHRSFVAKMNASTGTPLPDDPAKQPYATFFGDGSPIPDDFIALMHETFRTHAVAIPYEAGDFTIVHNLLVTHGREAYTPPRKVYVTMREKVELVHG